MEQKMFCYQCEQTVGCTACTGAAGVCGKKAGTAKLQDELTGALIGLARAVDGNEDLVTEKTDALMIESLFMTLTNVNFDDNRIQAQIDRVHREQGRMIPRCAVCASPCGRNEDYNMEQLWQAEENIRSLKSLLLFGLRGMAAYAYHAMVLGYTDNTVNQFFYEALMQIGLDLTMEELLPEVLKLGEVNLRCMALLDRANTETYGTPEPTKVSMQIDAGPFIVVTGHDLKDLQLLLEQTKDKGIAVYTRRDAAGTCVPEAESLSASQGQFRNSMAEPAERIRCHSGTGAVYYQLPDAAEAKLCRPCFYHRSSGLSGNGTHRQG